MVRSRRMVHVFWSGRSGQWLPRCQPWRICFPAGLLMWWRVEGGVAVVRPLDCCTKHVCQEDSGLTRSVIDLSIGKSMQAGRLAVVDDKDFHGYKRPGSRNVDNRAASGLRRCLKCRCRRPFAAVVQQSDERPMVTACFMIDENSKQ